MAGEEQKIEAPQVKPKEAGGWKWTNAPKAFSEAVKKFKEAKGFSKFTIFWETFNSEMRGIETAKKEVSAEAKKEAAKSVEDQMKEEKAAAKLDEKTPDADKLFFDEVLAMDVAARKELPVDADALMSGRAKLAQAAKGETPADSTLDEVKALGATGLLTLAKFKEKHGNPADFKAALDRLSKISDSSALPLQKLLSVPVLKVFSFKINMASEGVQAVGAALGLSDKSNTMKLLDSFHLSADDAKKLKGLKEQPIKDEAEIATIIKKSIFPNTSEANIRNVMKIANSLMTKTPPPDHIDTQTLTDLVFNVDDKDLKNLIEILTGKKDTGVAIVDTSKITGGTVKAANDNVEKEIEVPKAA